MLGLVGKGGIPTFYHISDISIVVMEMTYRVFAYVWSQFHFLSKCWIVTRLEWAILILISKWSLNKPLVNLTRVHSTLYSVLFWGDLERVDQNSRWQHFRKEFILRNSKNKLKCTCRMDPLSRRLENDRWSRLHLYLIWQDFHKPLFHRDLRWSATYTPQNTKRSSAWKARENLSLDGVKRVVTKM